VAIRSVGGAQLGADFCICLGHLSAVGLDVLRQQPAELAGKDCFHSFADQVESGLQTVYQLGHEGTYLVKAAATLVLERNKRCNKGATTTQKVMQQTTPENDPDCCLIRDMVIPPAAHLKDSIPDDGPRAEIWRLYLDSGDQVDAIRGRPMTLAEVLTEFPGERVVAAQPRLSKGESIQVGEDKT
jgi:hypothetical protein